ncbi:hypothetical protein RvY_17080-2 [Ramazzottius varieornatus]|uniref:NAD(P)H oxidase (H2O2-forming) n=1 Tax=Ramazzottius varieornatus TaxID=947166 RepID=A0A1D1W1D7_RAMVA|nr:hypothetical protein RvY_17080-2 [Ramazzottius varieornatus]
MACHQPVTAAPCCPSLSMPLLRTRYDRSSGQSPNKPRAQLNLMSSWIDGSTVYSTKDVWLSAMRSYNNGTLKVEAATNLPPFNTIGAPISNPPPSHINKVLDPARLFLLGDGRSNQHPPILAISILFYRLHNVMAARIQAQHPQWRDEQIFQRARRWVIAIMQNIALYEYLPAFLDIQVAPYNGYQADIHPGISDVFQAAAFRFGHTQIPAGIFVRDTQCHFKRTDEGYPAFRLCNTWFDSQATLQKVGGIEPIIMGLASQIAEKEDAIIIDDLREHIFGPMEYSRRDLAAVNVMRGRDYGLPDYNKARKAYKLRAIDKWSDINPELYNEKPEMFEELRQLYQDQLDTIDLYVGGMLECDGNKPGPLFTEIIREQFLRLRDADRFWFENRDNGFFNEQEIASIKATTLHDVIVAASDIPASAIQKNVFFWRAGDPCGQPFQLTGSMLEPCVSLGAVSRDVFAGNEVLFLLTCFILFCIIPALACLSAYLLVKYRGHKRRKYIKHHADQLYWSANNAPPLPPKNEQLKAKNSSSNLPHSDQMTHNHEYNPKYSVGNLAVKGLEKGSWEKVLATEWLHRYQSRPVKLKFGSDGQIHVENRKGDRLRTIKTRSVNAMMLEVTEDASQEPLALLRIHKEHDLVLAFDNIASCSKFRNLLKHFLEAQDKDLVVSPTSHEHIYTTAETKEKRQSRLERFFKIAYARAFGLDRRERSEEELRDCEEAMQLKLTRLDFAEALAMKPNCAFIQKMFNCIDKDGDGKISFQQFLDLIIRFSSGNAQDRLRVFFDMCDVDGTGLIEHTQLFHLLRSLLDMTASQKGTASMDAVNVWKIFEDLGLKGKKRLSFEDFLSIFMDHSQDLSRMGLDFKGVRQTFLEPECQSERLPGGVEGETSEGASGWAAAFHRKRLYCLTLLEENKQQAFYLGLYFVAVLGVWLERFSFYMFLNETNNLRQVMGVGIAITRGSAAAMSLSFAILLLTVSRNVITRLRETFLYHYIPFDSALALHKIVAMTGAFFALVHSVGHVINFYHVSTQPITHLKCLFKEMSFPPTPPSFAFWVYKTLTGLTGVLLVIVLCVMFVFALWPRIHQHAYRYFWLTHRYGYILFYILCILHGLPRLTGEARFPLYLIVPLIVFIIDRLMGIKQTALELEVIEAECLPSDVIHLKFARPADFEYRSGQWIRLYCTSFCQHESHPFTLTSMPHDGYLSVHVKAQGIWTWKLRQAFEGLEQHQLPVQQQLQPKLRIEGPFGGGNQDWYKYDVVVMVGAGMGVTPYASILKDLVFGTSTNRFSGFNCKKVYFVWICPSHKPFEWFVDTLHDIEKRDVTKVLEMHIFVTQFFHKFDLRTTMLYVCENHFQRLSKKSLFTGLKAINHFGRPDMPAFLQFVKQRHSHVSTVGVFSCGPPQMTRNVAKGCEVVNRQRAYPRFLHHYENF